MPYDCSWHTSARLLHFTEIPSIFAEQLKNETCLYVCGLFLDDFDGWTLVVHS